jgi:hypothetical protein
MAKIQIKSGNLTSFGGIFSVMEEFTGKLAHCIDSTLGLRCTHVGYQYSEIIRSLMCVFFCGGTCIEDISNYLLPTLLQHPHLRTCSSDTILRAIKELKTKNITYTAEQSGKSYDFNTSDKLNQLLINALLTTKQLNHETEYDFDFDHQFIEAEKYDAKMTYKKFCGYGPGVAVINDMIVGIENRDGNTNVRFHQQDTLHRIFTRLESAGIKINRARMDCGSCSEEIIKTVRNHCRYFYIRANKCASLYDNIMILRDWKRIEINGMEVELNSVNYSEWKNMGYRLVIQRQKRMDKDIDVWEGEYTYRCILTNDRESSEVDIVTFYNQRGAKERIFDEMNNDFGWSHLPKSFMAENTVFLLLTALIRNFYRLVICRDTMREFGLRSSSRMKQFVFRFISVPAKWIKTARQEILNIYSTNIAYSYAFTPQPG